MDLAAGVALYLLAVLFIGAVCFAAGAITAALAISAPAPLDVPSDQQHRRDRAEASPDSAPAAAAGALGGRAFTRDELDELTIPPAPQKRACALCTRLRGYFSPSRAGR